MFKNEDSLQDWINLRMIQEKDVLIRGRQLSTQNKGTLSYRRMKQDYFDTVLIN